MSIVSSLVGGILGSSAANNASQAEQTGAKQAQTLEQQNQAAAQTSQATATAQNQQAEQPYQQLGQTSANNLQSLLSKGFQAPTLAQAQQTPGYQFTLGQGTQAINENAAATGNLMSGNTGTALENYGQGLAWTTYQQDYQNALNTYMANYQSLQGGTNTGLTSNWTNGPTWTSGSAKSSPSGFDGRSAASAADQQCGGGKSVGISRIGECLVQCCGRDGGRPDGRVREYGFLGRLESA